MSSVHATVGLDATFRALSDPRRRRIVQLLGPQPHPPAALAAALQVSRPAVSRHLRILREAGLVHESADPTDGRGKLVHLQPAPLEAVANWASQAAAFWSDQLDALADFCALDEATVAAPLPDAVRTRQQGPLP